MKTVRDVPCIRSSGLPGSAEVTDIFRLYREAPDPVEHGERVVSNDELTGVQALEHKAPNLPLRPGMVERQEFEYVRHGTRSFVLNRDVQRSIEEERIVFAMGVFVRM